MSEEEPLSIEKLTKYESEMMMKITRLISLQPKSKEMAAATTVALGNILVMMLNRMVGRDKAVEYAATILSRSFQIMGEFGNWQDEKNTDTKTSGG